MTVGCLAYGHRAKDCQVRDHMSGQRTSVSTGSILSDLSIIVIENDIDYLPVVEEGEPPGIVRSSDLFQALESVVVDT